MKGLIGIDVNASGYDKNGDGKITKAEFSAVMKKVSRLSDAEISDMIRKADTNGDG